MREIEETPKQGEIEETPKQNPYQKHPQQEHCTYLTWFLKNPLKNGKLKNPAYYQCDLSH